MNQEKYRLIRGKLHRPNPLVLSGYETFKRGTIFVPTDEELRIHRDAFEGPIDPSEEHQPATANEPEPALRAAEDLKMDVAGIKDVVRAADANYLGVLRTVEAQRQPLPRKKVLEMIDRRVKVLEFETPAAVHQ